MGGGSLMTPLLVLVFGFKPSVAIGTDIVHGAIFKSFGAVQHRRLGHVHARLTAWMLLGSAPFSIIGVALAWWLTKRYGDGYEDTAKVILGVALVVLRARVPRQGVPPLGRRTTSRSSSRPRDRVIAVADGRRRRLRRRAHLGGERHDLRARDADRVPAHRGEDRRHGHLPRGDAARGRRRRAPGRRAASTSGATGWLLIGSIPGVLHRRPVHGASCPTARSGSCSPRPSRSPG